MSDVTFIGSLVRRFLMEYLMGERNLRFLDLEGF